MTRVVFAAQIESIIRLSTVDLFWHFQWRRFNFFDKEILRNFEGSSSEPFDKLKVSNRA